ncbi:MAG: hypothetical protein CL521_00805, partial [Actinobacteria bacterium]|nr:hypothetical protein [Actinomycetota bacterium]
KALEIYLPVLGEGYPIVGDIYYNMALLYKTQAQKEKERQNFLLAAEVYENAYGKEHSKVINALAQAQACL